MKLNLNMFVNKFFFFKLLYVNLFKEYVNTNQIFGVNTNNIIKFESIAD